MNWGKNLSFKGGLGISNMEHISGNQKISEAGHKEREGQELIKIKKTKIKR